MRFCCDFELPKGSSPPLLSEQFSVHHKLLVIQRNAEPLLDGVLELPDLGNWLHTVANSSPLKRWQCGRA
jgi:hypothetical protein